MKDADVVCFMVEQVSESGRQVRRVDTGEVYDSLAACPPGAMWDAPWMHDHGKITGGPVLAGPNADGLFR